MLNNEKIIGKILIKAKIDLISPIHIGCGSGERSKLDILLDDNNRPFIPGTSIAGVLNQMIIIDDKKNLKFWGYLKEDNTGSASLFFCSDATVSSDSPDIVISIRDGIRIDSLTGTTIDSAKYDYEILEPGVIFDFKMIFTFYDDNKDFVKSMARTIYDILNSNNMQVGAKTGSGLGYIKLVQNQTNIYLYDFTQKDHVINWLMIHNNHYSSTNKIELDKLGKPFTIKDNSFKLCSSLKIRHSFIIRSNSDIPELDEVHISSAGKPIITGSAIKGAIRARIERILYSLGNRKEKVDCIMKKLFGYIDKNDNSKDSQKSRVTVKETILPSFIAQQQSRIKIDRFTGGTIQSALFNTMPLFVNLNDKAVNIEIEIKDCQKYEAGLLLLVLKDLWTGDLAVGGEKSIGRGTFEGFGAEISFDDEKFNIEKQFTEKDSEKLQKYIDELVEFSGD